MMKRLLPLLFTGCVTLLFVAACHAPALEEIQGPDWKEEPTVDSKQGAIPFSLTVNTESTRVSYDDVGNAYAFKTGDKLRVVGMDRPDIVGELTQNGNVWTGNLSYTEGAPTSSTKLSVTLIHADNPDVETYGTAIVGSVPEGSSNSLLREAVESYSLFTADNVPFTTSSDSPQAVTLLQQATFLQVHVEFDFDGSHIIDAGKALVDLKLDGRELTEETHFHEKPNTNGEDFYVGFVVVVPGGKKTDEFTITVGDRAISFQSVTELVRNKKYTITRTIEFHPQLGDPFWSDGTYGRLRHPDSEERIVGIVVYVNQNNAIGDAITEKAAGYGHGLVMALTNAGVDKKWSESGGKFKCTEDFVTSPEQTLVSNHLSGFANTQSILTKLGDKSEDLKLTSAAWQAYSYTNNGVSVSTSSTTGWFLPSIGQWMYTISTDGFGGANPAAQWVNGNGVSWLINGYGDSSGDLGDLVLVKECGDERVNVLVKSLNDRLEQLKTEFGVTYDSFGDPSATNNVSDNYWTSSEFNDNQALRMNLGSVKKRGNTYYSTIKVKGQEKNVIKAYTENNVDYNMKVRPFLAF